MKLNKWVEITVERELYDFNGKESELWYPYIIVKHAGQEIVIDLLDDAKGFKTEEQARKYALKMWKGV